MHVLYITGSPDAHLNLPPGCTGQAKCLAKPFGPRQLLEAVRVMLGR
jgi:hypothetical protein